jgi:hypothetical protein
VSADVRDDDGPVFDPPDVDAVYARYLVTCRRLGVTAVPRDRARKLIEEWTDTLARGGAPPITH